MHCRVDDSICRQCGNRLRISCVQGHSVFKAGHGPERVGFPWYRRCTEQGQVGPGLKLTQPGRRPVKGIFAPQFQHQRIRIRNHACRSCSGRLLHRCLAGVGLRLSQPFQRCQRRFSGNDLRIVARAFPHGQSAQSCAQRFGQGRLPGGFDAGDGDADNGGCVHSCGMKLNHPSRASRV